MSFDAKQEISSSQLAELIGVTERRVQQLEAEGVFDNVGKGRSKRYILLEAVRAWAEKSEIDAKNDAPAAGTSREMFEQERARKFKLENDAREAQLIEIEHATGAVDFILGDLVTSLAGLAARFTDDLAERRRLDILIDEIRGSLAARFDKAGEHLRAGRDPLAADAALDA